MRLPGWAGKGRRHRQDLGPSLREGAVQSRKPQVVANTKAQLSPGRLHDSRLGARTIALRLVIPLGLRQGDIEHVNFIIKRNNLPLCIDHNRAVGKAAVIAVGFDRHRAKRNPKSSSAAPVHRWPQ